MKLIIRDSYATLNGDKTTHELPSGGLQIVDQEGDRSLWDIRLRQDGSLEVSAGIVCKHDGVILDDAVLITPVSGNHIIINRQPYK